MVVTLPPSLPIGTTLSAVPANATTDYVGSTLYFVSNGVYYKLQLVNGQVQYVVVNNPQ